MVLLVVTLLGFDDVHNINELSGLNLSTEILTSVINFCSNKMED